MPPQDFKGHIVTTHDKLSIYQAWNLALSTVQTPYVMNLNLDDRLAMDAVEVMENALDSGSDLVGGDWKICYSQEETDAVTPSFPANELPFSPAWPPAGDLTRLGSGTGSRGTLGPACMWRAHLHQTLAKYPCMFGDGTLIRVIGDAVWWHLLIKNNKKVQRVPRIIGNYYSHPKDQAEFRNPASAEQQRLNLLGLR